MSEPMDTSAEAVERWASDDETPPWLVPVLRTTAKERDELQLAHTEAAAHYAARVAELEAQCARVQRDAARYRFIDDRPYKAAKILDEMGTGMLSVLIDAAMAAKEAG